MAVQDYMNLPRYLHLLQDVPNKNITFCSYNSIFTIYSVPILSLKIVSRSGFENQDCRRNTKLISAFQTKIFQSRLKKILLKSIQLGCEIPEEQVIKGTRVKRQFLKKYDYMIIDRVALSSDLQFHQLPI